MNGYFIILLIIYKATMRTFLITIFACTIICYKGSAQNPAETIPDFIFYSFEDVPFTNKNLPVGKEILFVFFDVNCDHCHNTIKTLSTRIDEFEKIAIYLISLENKVIIENFLNVYGKNLITKTNVMILQDLKDQFINQFRPRKYPSIFLYSSTKKLILYSDEDQYLEKFLKIINDESN